MKAATAIPNEVLPIIGQNGKLLKSQPVTVRGKDYIEYVFENGKTFLVRKDKATGLNVILSFNENAGPEVLENMKKVVVDTLTRPLIAK